MHLTGAGAGVIKSIGRPSKEGCGRCGLHSLSGINWVCNTGLSGKVTLFLGDPETRLTAVSLSMLEFGPERTKF